MTEFVDYLFEGSIMIFLFYIAWYDRKTMLIPNRYLIPLLLLVLLTVLWQWENGEWLNHLLGIVAVSLPMYGLTLLVPDCFGGGDIKLMAICGGWLGWQAISVAMFLAVITGGIYGIYLLGWKKKKAAQHFAFGPFLVAGIFVAWLWGEKIWQWYVGLL